MPQNDGLIKCYGVDVNKHKVLCTLNRSFRIRNGKWEIFSPALCLDTLRLYFGLAKGTVQALSCFAELPSSVYTQTVWLLLRANNICTVA